MGPSRAPCLRSSRRGGRRRKEDRTLLQEHPLPRSRMRLDQELTGPGLGSVTVGKFRLAACANALYI
jgi:hypothetical protein